jgi:hypothetical protein
MRGWAQGQPRKMVGGRILAKQKPKCRSSGYRLQFGGAENGLLAIRLQSSNTHFLCRPHEQFKVLS